MYSHATPAPSSRLLPFAAIVLAHLGLFYALQHGLIAHTAQLLTKEIVLQLMPATPAPVEPPKARKLAQLKKLTDPALEVPALALSTTPVVTAMPAPAIHTAEAAPPPTRNEPGAGMIGNAAPAPMAQPKQVSAVDYLQAPQAEYPPLSRRMGEEGKVMLRVVVNEKGQAEKVEIQKSSGYNRLDEAARSAILRAIFKPYLEDGKALSILATATISFSLNS